MPQIFVKIKRHLYWLVTHFEIWAASPISAIIGSVRTESGRATARQPMWPGSRNRRVGPAALSQVALGLFWLFLQPNNSQCSNCQIRNTRISTASVTPIAWNPGEGPLRSFQSRLCHQFHLFYQVHIRLGCPHCSPRCFRYLHPNNSHGSSSPNRPAQPIGAFPKLHETRTLWQF